MKFKDKSIESCEITLASDGKEQTPCACLMIGYGEQAQDGTFLHGKEVLLEKAELELMLRDINTMFPGDFA